VALGSHADDLWPPGCNVWQGEVFRFEDFELDRGACELRRGGSRVQIERIPFELLCLLVEGRSRVVPREEIIERIGGKDVFLEAEHSVNTAIRKVRVALATTRMYHALCGPFRAAAIAAWRPFARRTPSLLPRVQPHRVPSVSCLSSYRSKILATIRLRNTSAMG
jgi:Transcriptional regulatory protein, C terminal